MLLSSGRVPVINFDARLSACVLFSIGGRNDSDGEKDLMLRFCNFVHQRLHLTCVSELPDVLMLWSFV